MFLPTVFMFSGQGSQYFHMGRSLFETDPVFRYWMHKLDEIVRDLTGNSVINRLYDPERSKSEIFADLALTHPAIYMVQFSLSRRLIDAGKIPDVTMGTSLGAFVAATISGMISYEDGLSAVVKQSRAISANCELGGMISILASPALYEYDFLRQNTELAAINFENHFTVSGRKVELDALERDLAQRNIACQRLSVSFPFHSKWIDPAKPAFDASASGLFPRTAAIPMICCESPAMRTELPSDYFWRVARNPIKFREAVDLLEKRGSFNYIDVGPAGTLATFLKYVLPANSGSGVRTLFAPYGDDLNRLQEYLKASSPQNLPFGSNE